MTELIVKDFGGVDVPTIGSITFIGGENGYWAWSPYKLCSFRCVYCSVEAQGKSSPLITKEEIGPLLDDFEKYAGNGNGNDYPFALGACTDGYPLEEAEHELTRQTLIEIAKRKIRTVIITHGDMITRDIELLKQMPMLDGIGVSITHHDNEHLKKTEPGAPPFEKRIEAVYKLYEAGLPVHVNIAPWIPGITDADKIASQLPSDMKVNVGVLSFNKQQSYLTKHVFGREVGSAERVFGKRFDNDQQKINAFFMEAYEATGWGSKGNLKWLIPPGSGKNFINHLPDIKKPLK